VGNARDDDTMPGPCPYRGPLDRPGPGVVSYPGHVKNWVEQSGLDRVEDHRRNDAWVARLWEREDALLLKMDSEGRFSTDPSGSELRLVRPHVEFNPQLHYLLGLVEGQPVFAAETLVDDSPVHTAREVGARLSAVERDLVFMARALTNWHRLEPRCPSCGGETEVLRGGVLRHCAQCGRDSWPRTDPAVIVAVVNPNDDILLAHQRGWAAGRVSLIAGFVEAGESLEQAIHREILEETDIEVAQVRYVGSQPWPFPRSLMMGFTARAVTTDITADDHELAWVQWYSRDRVRAEAAAGRLVLPGKASLAHRLIKAWLDGRITCPLPVRPVPLETVPVQPR